MQNELFPSPGSPMDAASSWQSFLNGWTAIGEWETFVPLIGSVLAAIVLALPLAYHPKLRGQVYTLEDVEKRKAVVIFSALSAAIAMLVTRNSYMALVVFGIGGLIRLRTTMGTAMGSLWAVAAIVIGLATGLGLYALALVLSALAFVLIYLLEGSIPVQFTLKKIQKDQVAVAVHQLRGLARERGWKLLGERVSMSRGQVSLILMIPPRMDPNEVEASILEALPPKTIGSMEWESS